MKHNTAIWFLILALLQVTAEAKTCKAVFNGKVKKQEIFLPNPHVFYPRSLHSKIAQWSGMGTTKAFVTPPAIEIECGKPSFYGEFEPFQATGMLPEYIETFPWETIGFDGKPTIVPEERLYGIGDSGDYPLPPIYFKTSSPVVIEQAAPAGVKDICDLQTLKLDNMFFKTEIEPDYMGIYYTSNDVYGHYSWDNTKSPKGLPVEVELEKPTVTIICENAWEYEMEMDWPFIVNADDPSMCGPGEVHRNMKVKGFFMAKEDNEVIGYIDVEVPTVTYSGSLWGAYQGQKFSQTLTGKVYNDDSGKSWVDIDMLTGGHGISWLYKLTCPYGATQVFNLFGAVYQYLWIYNVNETESEANPGFFKFDATGDDRTIVVDKGGQGTVTFRRSFKRMMP